MMGDKQGRSCSECEHFYQGHPGSRINPPEDPECGVSLAVMNLPNWPFINGCKHFKAKTWRPRHSIYLGEKPRGD